MIPQPVRVAGLALPAPVNVLGAIGSIMINREVEIVVGGWKLVKIIGSDERKFSVTSSV